MAGKHTPGPWVADCFRIDNGFGYTVAILPNENREPDSETTRADAQLIAAAPALLDALHECEDYFDQRADADCDQDGYIPNEEMKLLQVVREALGKAGAA